MIKKPVLDSIDRKLTHMRKLYTFLRKNKSHPMAKPTYRSLKREARDLDTLMREAVQRGDVEFPDADKT